MDDISRRKFIGGAASLGISALGLRAFGQEQTAQDARRNILIFFGDQQHAEMMSCAGNPHLKTPHMDWLAENGVRFTNNYCTYPLCGPSRGSMWTGLMPHQNGIMRNNDGYREGLHEQALGNLVGPAGYNCFYGGKWHIGDKKRVEETEARCGFKTIGRNHFAASGNKAHAEISNCDLSDPFLLVTSFQAPHHICDFRRRAVKGEFKKKVPVEQCPPLPENFMPPDVEPEAVTRRGNERARDYFDEATWRRYREYYARDVESLDNILGNVLGALREKGVLENTTIIFTSDHGDGDAAHQWPGKRCFYEESVKVPLIIAGAGVGRKGATCEALASGLDLVPTACELAGAQAPADLPGRSLVPWLSGEPAEPWREMVVSQVRSDIQGRMIRTERYKYACYLESEHPEVLFDLQEDPGEMHNLAYGGAHEGLLKEYRGKLSAWCKQAGDTFPEQVEFL